MPAWARRRHSLVLADGLELGARAGARATCVHGVIASVWEPAQANARPGRRARTGPRRGNPSGRTRASRRDARGVRGSTPSGAQRKARTPTPAGARGTRG